MQHCIAVKDIIEEDFTNYCKPSMFIAFPKCSFKCDKESGVQCCQNSHLATSPDIMVKIEDIITRYKNNPITKALVCGGLEPFDSFYDLLLLILNFRLVSSDDIVIYTGYKEEEIEDRIAEISAFENIIVKFGRFIPTQKEPHYDSVLGINLNSPNQYARKLKNYEDM